MKNTIKIWSACGWRFFCILIASFGAMTSHAQLLVKVSPLKITGSKALVKMEMVNGFPEKVNSARAVCFLLDQEGKVAGQSAQWVIGGSRKASALEAGKTNWFNFVVPAEKVTNTNLTSRVTFTRIVLEGGKLVNVRDKVNVEASSTP